MLVLAVLVTVVVGLVLLQRWSRRRRSPSDAPCTSPAPMEASPVPSGVAEIAVARAGAAVGEATLHALFALNAYDDAAIKRFALEKRAEHYPAGSLLFRRGGTQETALYLLEGTVLLEPASGRAPEISGGTPQARYPLNAASSAGVTAYAKTDVLVLRMPLPSPAKLGIQGSQALRQIVVPSELASSSLFYVFRESFEKNELVLPAMPMVAMRLQKAMREDAGIGEAARIIQMDPAIAAHLVHVANSPLYRTAKAADSCLAAVSVLGLTATHNLVVSLSLNHLFQARQPRIRKFMEQLWRRSVYLSAICFVLARRTTGVDPDKALLAGLTSQLGVVPFLCFADDFPAESYAPQELDAIMPLVAGPLGRHILASWEFPEDLVELPELADQWFYDSGRSLPDLAELLVLANWHSHLGTPRMADLPSLATLPAFGKLSGAELSPEASLSLLSEAKEQINAACAFFRH